MNIYFAGSIRGGRQDKALYVEIIQMLGRYGTVLTEHVADTELSEIGEDGPNDDYIYTRDLKWLETADLVIAEVTQPSHGVGYEITKAEEWGKRIICLYRPAPDKRLSAMLAGSPKLTIVEYQTVADLEPILQECFQTLEPV